QIRLVERDTPDRIGTDSYARQLIEIVALLKLLVHGLAIAKKEPELVPLDRAAEGPAGVVVLLDPAGQLKQAARAQVVGEIVGLKTLGGVGRLECPRERVAAVFGHHVDLDAARA